MKQPRTNLGDFWTWVLQISNPKPWTTWPHHLPKESSHIYLIFSVRNFSQILPAKHCKQVQKGNKNIFPVWVSLMYSFCLQVGSEWVASGWNNLYYCNTFLRIKMRWKKYQTKCWKEVLLNTVMECLLFSFLGIDGSNSSWWRD